ncbi:MAG: hypothetical protein N4A45_09325 [Flavobacteriales bacterium]|jgi:hypothetical protein|nr:hypothetical protein [Flavobacteriales bacterium]
MNKTYNILVNELLIGKTELEKADAPMGVVYGFIEFYEIKSPYLFFRDLCFENNITINTDDPEFEFIDTQIIPELKVFRNDGLEIKGIIGNAITGMKDEGYEISILGIPYPFYQDEFPHHTRKYENTFKKDQAN